MTFPNSGSYRLSNARIHSSLAPGLSLAVDADGFSLVDIEVAGGRIARIGTANAPDGFDLKGRSGPFSGQATADRIALTNATAAPLLAGRIAADLAGTLSADTLTVSRGSLKGDALNGAFDGTVSLTGGAIALNMKADAAASALPAAARGVMAHGRRGGLRRGGRPF